MSSVLLLSLVSIHPYCEHSSIHHSPKGEEERTVMFVVDGKNSCIQSL